MKEQVTSNQWTEYLHELSTFNGELIRYPQRRFDFQCGTVLINQSMDDVGYTVWDAEVILAHMLTDFELRDKCVLEIGAGTALASIVACKMGAKAYVQDLDHVLSRTQSNMTLNNVKFEAVAGEWGHECATKILQTVSSSVDMVFMADVLYNFHSFSCLNQTIVECTSSGCKLLIAYEQRRCDLKPYFDTLLSNFTPVKEVYYEVPNESYSANTKFCIHLLIRN